MFDWLIQNWLDVVDVIAYIIAAASIVVKLTPTENDNVVVQKVINILKALSLYKEPKL